MRAECGVAVASDVDITVEGIVFYIAGVFDYCWEAELGAERFESGSGCKEFEDGCGG